MHTSGILTGDDIKSLSSDELIHCCKGLSEQYDQSLARVGLTQSPPNSGVWREYLQLPVEQQKKIIELIESAIWQYSELASQGPENEDATKPGELSLQQEISMLRRDVFRRRMKLADDSILDLIDEEDIIEVFNQYGVQVYRSWSYFKYSSYSLIDLLIYDWNTLFVRPSHIVNKLYDISMRVSAPGAKTMPFDLPEYILKERSSLERRTLSLQMKYISPLVDQATGATVGLICTGRADILSRESAETSTLEFV